MNARTERLLAVYTDNAGLVMSGATLARAQFYENGDSVHVSTAELRDNIESMR